MFPSKHLNVTQQQNKTKFLSKPLVSEIWAKQKEKEQVKQQIKHEWCKKKAQNTNFNTKSVKTIFTEKLK